MDQILRPAHEVLLQMAESTCRDLKALDQGITSTSGRLYIGAGELYVMRAIRIGQLCGHMDVLQKMIIPEESLGKVIGALNKLDYTHAVIFVTARMLVERQKAIASSNASESATIEGEAFRRCTSQAFDEASWVRKAPWH